MGRLALATKTDSLHTTTNNEGEDGMHTYLWKLTDQKSAGVRPVAERCRSCIKISYEVHCGCPIDLAMLLQCSNLL